MAHWLLLVAHAAIALGKSAFADWRVQWVAGQACI